MLESVRQDIEAIKERDPAAGSALSVALTYPGVHARLVHRASQALWLAGLRLPARLLALLGRWLTGIEIHPAARIGERFFIDHGMGVVIGETAVIGDDVTLYQGVTLGGIGRGASGRRHPSLGDGVVVGAGAQVLGDITIGAGAKVGANAVVLHDVAPGHTVVGVPARVVKDSSSAVFAAYGVDPQGNDPLLKTVEKLAADVEVLKSRLGLDSSKKDSAA